MIGTNVPDKDVPSRDRVLSDTEIRIVWQATAGTDDYSKIIRLLILLGNRRAEIGRCPGTRSTRHGTVTIPGSRTKGGNTLTLTLPDSALAILQSVERRADNDFVFGGNRIGFVGWSKVR